MFYRVWQRLLSFLILTIFFVFFVPWGFAGFVYQDFNDPKKGRINDLEFQIFDSNCAVSIWTSQINQYARYGEWTKFTIHYGMIRERLSDRPFDFKHVNKIEIANYWKGVYYFDQFEIYNGNELILTYQDFDPDYDSDGVDAWNGTLSWSSDYAHDGNYSLKLIAHTDSDINHFKKCIIKSEDQDTPWDIDISDGDRIVFWVKAFPEGPPNGSHGLWVKNGQGMITVTDEEMRGGDGYSLRVESYPTIPDPNSDRADGYTVIDVKSLLADENLETDFLTIENRNDRLVFWVKAFPEEANPPEDGVHNHNWAVKFFDNNHYQYNPDDTGSGFLAWTAHKAIYGEWTRLEVLFTQLPDQYIKDHGGDEPLDLEHITRLELQSWHSGIFYIDDICIVHEDLCYQCFDPIKCSPGQPAQEEKFEYGWAWSLTSEEAYGITYERASPKNPNDPSWYFDMKCIDTNNASIHFGGTGIRSQNKVYVRPEWMVPQCDPNDPNICWTDEWKAFWHADLNLGINDELSFWVYAEDQNYSADNNGDEKPLEIKIYDFIDRPLHGLDPDHGFTNDYAVIWTDRTPIYPGKWTEVVISFDEIYRSHKAFYENHEDNTDGLLLDQNLRIGLDDLNKIEISAYWCGKYFIDDIIARSSVPKWDMSRIDDGIIKWSAKRPLDRYRLQVNRGVPEDENAWEDIPIAEQASSYKISELRDVVFRVQAEEIGNDTTNSIPFVSAWSKPFEYMAPLVTLDYKELLVNGLLVVNSIQEGFEYVFEYASDTPDGILYWQRYESTEVLDGYWFRACAVNGSEYGEYGPALFKPSSPDDGFLKAYGPYVVREKKDSFQKIPVRLNGVNLGSYLLLEGWMVDIGTHPDDLKPIQGCDPGNYHNYRPMDDGEIRDDLILRFDEERTRELLGIFQRSYITKDDFDIMYRLGINLIRLPIYFRLFEDEYGNPVEDPNMWERIDFIIKMAADRGMYVILDLHGAPGYQNNYFHSGHTGISHLWDETPEGEWFRERTVSLWKRIAKRYKDNPTVFGYDLLNEPTGVLEEVDFGIFSDTNCRMISHRWKPTSAERAALCSFYNRLYDAIRHDPNVADRNHVIFMEGIWDWDTLPDPGAWDFKNVIYEFHYYNWNALYSDAPLLNHQSYLEHCVEMAEYWQNKKGYHVPVLIGEFNPISNDIKAWDIYLDTFNNEGWAYTLWSYKIKPYRNAWGLLTDIYWSDPNIYPEDIPIINPVTGDSDIMLSEKFSNYLTLDRYVYNNGTVEVFSDYAHEGYAIRADKIHQAEYFHEAQTRSGSNGVILDYFVTYSGGYVGSFDKTDKDYMAYNGLIFDEGMQYFKASLAVKSTDATNKSFYVSIDSSNQYNSIAEMNPDQTQGWGHFEIQTCKLKEAVTGIHNVYIVADRGDGICNLNWFTFSREQFKADEQIEAEVFYDPNFDYDSANERNMPNSIKFFEYGDALLYKDILFSSRESNAFFATVLCSSDNPGQKIEIHLDTLDGEPIGILELKYANCWTTQSAPIKPVNGLHDVYLVFEGGPNADNIGEIDYFTFKKSSFNTISATDFDEMSGLYVYENEGVSYLSGFDAYDGALYRDIDFRAGRENYLKMTLDHNNYYDSNGIYKRYRTGKRLCVYKDELLDIVGNKIAEVILPPPLPDFLDSGPLTLYTPILTDIPDTHDIYIMADYGSYDIADIESFSFLDEIPSATLNVTLNGFDTHGDEQLLILVPGEHNTMIITGYGQPVLNDPNSLTFAIQSFGDDPVTGIKDGAVQGDPLTFYLWTQNRYIDITTYISERIYWPEPDITLNIGVDNIIIPFSYNETPDSMYLYGEIAIDGTPAETGDWIGVFAEGVATCNGCIGVCMIMDDGTFNITAYGDNSLTPDLKDGADYGDILHFKLWDKSEGRLVDLCAIDDNDPLYTGRNNILQIGLTNCSKVTFRVDMSLVEDVSSKGIHLTGKFEHQNSWIDSNDIEVIKLSYEADGIYAVTLSLPKNQKFYYKFINGDVWQASEIVPLECGVLGAYNEYYRTVTINGTDDMMLDIPFFGTCEYSTGFLKAKDGKFMNKKGDLLLRGVNLGGWLVPEGYMLKLNWIRINASDPNSAYINSTTEIRNLITHLIGTEMAEEFFSAYEANFITERDIDFISSLGFNCIRMPLHYNKLISPDGQWLETGFAQIDRCLSWCKEYKLYLILDMHCAPGGQNLVATSDYQEGIPSLWEDQSRRDTLVTIWREIANRYKDEIWIGGYDLINETDWDLGEENMLLMELMQDITSAIREDAGDVNHIIFVEGNKFATDFNGLIPPWDNNMSYSFHKYWNKNFVAQIDDYLKLREEYNVPLFVGEFGENSNSWIRDCLDLLERNNISWAFWPVKSLDSITSLLSSPVTDEYENLLDELQNGRLPSADEAYSALMGMVQDLSVEKCKVNIDIIDVLFRESDYNTVSIPYAEHNIPGIIYCVDYDMGRKGYAYHDWDYENVDGLYGPLYNSGKKYRNDGVDIEECSDPASNGFNVGWIGSGEWLKYTINVTETDLYDMEVHFASPYQRTIFHIEIDGSDITGPVLLPNTGGWQNWDHIVINNRELIKGNRELKVVFDTGGFNMSYMNIYRRQHADNLSLYYNYYIISSYYEYLSDNSDPMYQYNGGHSSWPVFYSSNPYYIIPGFRYIFLMLSNNYLTNNPNRLPRSW